MRVAAFLLLLSQTATAQSDYGGTVGVAFSLGTHLNRIGITTKGFFQYGQWQGNAAATFFWNYRAWGIKQGGWEHQESIGITYGFGEKKELERPVVFLLNHQTPYKYSFGYAYNFYADQNETNQKTGTFAIKLNRLQFITENDAFSWFPNDRYRTAAAAFRYEINENLYLAAQTTLWTGDPFYRTIQAIYEDYPYEAGYEDMTSERFIENSHGIVAAQVIALLPYQQTLSANLGIDAERVRHTLQNRFIHDLPFIPKKLNVKKQPHIPMVADDGAPYLFRPEQRLRPSRLWANINGNVPYFY